MARYKYNASLVEQAVASLNSAADAIANVHVEINKGISQIQNARASQDLQADYSAITGYQSLVTEFIDSMSTTITTKAKEIEEYNAQPVWKKVFATIGLGALKIVEGLGTFVENIGDGLVSVVGFAGGIFNSEFKNACAEYVMKDHVGDAFSNAYEAETGALAWLNDNSYMSHQSTAANILKGIGVATGYVVVSVATGGLGAVASTGIAAGTALVGGIGSGTQQGLKTAQATALATGAEFKAGDAFNSAFAQGVKQGAIAAGTTLVTAGVGKALQGAKMTKNGIQIFDDVINSSDEAYQTLSATGKALNNAKNAANVVGNKLLNNKVGLAVIEGIQSTDDVAAALNGTKGARAAAAIKNAIPGVKNINFGATAGSVINGGASIVGQAVSGGFEVPVADAKLDLQIQQVEQARAVHVDQVTPQDFQETQTIYGDTAEYNTAPLTNPPSVDIPTNGETPTTPTTPTTTPQRGPSSPTTTPVTTPPVTTPVTTPATTPVTQPSTTSPISTQPITTPSETTGPTLDPSISGTDPLTDLPSTSDDVLNSGDILGNSVGSLSGISESSVNIPTSSTPILSGNGLKAKSSSVIPVVAGLSAAGIAGIGTKAYLDKRESDEEEEEENNEIATEEWQEEPDAMEIDYNEGTEESDYLMPTDEYAFQEN